ncbi:MAG: F0F1 ATP synthase subunit A [Alphaproteobacteria bacterium]|nr:F0F1 ATP synthase subunit A [Alphaproteobacteria bacterium]
MAGPLEQFEIQSLIPIVVGGVDISFTNSAAMMVLASAVAGGLMLLGIGRGAMVPGRMQLVPEMLYQFVADLIRDIVGAEGRRYFPLVLTIFLFILAGNLLGMIPFAFTFTSHIIVTFALAITIFIGVTVLGFVRHGAHYLTLFAPGGVSKYMLIFLIPIELMSYLVRPISLSVRLFANMVAGHTLLKVLAGFIPALYVGLGYAGAAVGVLPLALITALTGLELLIAVLQAFVFAVLTCIYINDAVHLH